MKKKQEAISSSSSDGNAAANNYHSDSDSSINENLLEKQQNLELTASKKEQIRMAILARRQKEGKIAQEELIKKYQEEKEKMK